MWCFQWIPVWLVSCHYWCSVYKIMLYWTIWYRELKCCKNPPWNFFNKLEKNVNKLNLYQTTTSTIGQRLYINGLVQECSNSTANALELLQSCTKPLIHDMESFQLSVLQLLYTLSSHQVCNSFEDRAPVDEIWGCSIFKWVADTWQGSSLLIPLISTRVTYTIFRMYCSFHFLISASVSS